MSPPVRASIIRRLFQGQERRHQHQGHAGCCLKAADSGTVAAITKAPKGVAIALIRHPDNVLTVYANVANVSSLG